MPKPRKNQTILSDIARSCGLSLAAVSLALNNKPGISHETRIRVLEIAHSMGYHIKIPDAASAAGSVKTIGLLIRSYAEDEVHANLYFSHIFSNIETVCHQMDISLMFSALPVDTEHRPLLVPPVLEKWDVDGIIVAGVALNEELARALSDRWRKVIPFCWITRRGRFRKRNICFAKVIVGLRLLGAVTRPFAATRSGARDSSKPWINIVWTRYR
jgi:DNA-binding LacI/PurR family transcriptional regulator